MRRRSEFRQLLTGMSMSRYFPPMGTAGFERCAVRGKSRVPRPPPRITASASFITFASSAAFSHAAVARCQCARASSF